MLAKMQRKCKPTHNQYILLSANDALMEDEFYKVNLKRPKNNPKNKYRNRK